MQKTQSMTLRRLGALFLALAMVFGALATPRASITAKAADIPNLSADSALLDFGEFEVGQAGDAGTVIPAQTIKLKNSGSADIVFLSSEV